MPVFQFGVRGYQPVVGTIEVEANNEDEAWEKAQEDPLTWVEWEPSGDPNPNDVEITDCRKVSE